MLDDFIQLAYGYSTEILACLNCLNLFHFFKSLNVFDFFFRMQSYTEKSTYARRHKKVTWLPFGRNCDGINTYENQV